MALDALNYYVYRLLGAVAPQVAPETGYRIAERVGSLIYRWSPRRGAVEDNLAHVMGEPANSPHVRATARQVFRNQAKNYFDLLRLDALGTDEIRAAVSERIGFEHMDRALAGGHGVVLVSAHFGNIDLAGQTLALHGYRVTAAAEHLRPERLFQYLRTLRESHGLSFIPIDGSLRPLFRAVRDNEIVGLAIDRNVTDAGHAVEFFGRTALLPDGYLRFALRTGAALVPAFCCRLPDNRFRLTVEPPIELTITGDLAHDTEANLGRVLKVFATHLSQHPDQWVLFQQVWPQQPFTPGR
jgi:phosphatidylinositol dimannoside acyltransferase